MAHNIRALTGGAVKYLKNHESTLVCWSFSASRPRIEDSRSTPLKHLPGDDPTPWRHQVIELPPIKPVVTEYQWPQLACPACGATTRAPWPAGVPSGTYGPRVQATVALYTGSYRLSKRTTQQAMSEVLGGPIRVGTISQWEPPTTAVLDAPVEEARTYVHEQAV